MFTELFDVELSVAVMRVSNVATSIVVVAKADNKLTIPAEFTVVCAKFAATLVVLI